ncbi:MAG TPA: DUF3857 domain-containing protein [Thermoanaerobaculia bacterium]|nr:DUF3857 domain-containing protein [Thermoanaerobaculia bacterium]
MRKAWSWSAASLALGLALSGPVPAATILERSVEIDIRPDGSVLERERLAVRLDTPADYSAWSSYPIFLDQNRTLEELSASATSPEGKVVKVGRKDQDTVDFTSEGELHSSRQAKVVSFPVVPPGSVLRVDSTVREEPYFPAGAIFLGSSNPVEKLRVEVRGAGADWRWRIDGSRDGLTVQESPGSVVITAANLPRREPPDLAPAEAGVHPVLRYGWRGAATWQDVGRWYEGLLRDVPRAAEPVRRRARELAASAPSSRDRLAALLAFAAKQVRYVAVEVGIGGYRPAPPEKVMERRWGDCKDKALLLIDLLREAGVEAYPALILLAEDERIDPEFPSHDQFNHLIVAVAADGLAAPGDPVSEGLLFVDPTDETGSISWLHPGVQDQYALVVRGDRSGLVRTPLRPALEETSLQVELKIEPDGSGRGGVRLDLEGDLGSSFQRLAAASRPEEMEQGVRGVLGRLLPGAALSQVRWAQAGSDVPAFTISAQIQLPGLLPAGGLASSFSLPSGANTPSTGLLQDRTEPLVLTPGTSLVSWRITLPDGACVPKPDEQTVENDLGAFRQTVTLDGKVLKLERSLDLRQRWIDPSRFAAFKELALADQRSAKRRIRLECPAG